MTIYSLDTIDSTQRYLIELLKSKQLSAPVCIVAHTQTSGEGSRGNSWIAESGNLFLSFAYPKSELPQDLKLESSSIYFSYIMKQVLQDRGSKLWLKWPNDFYLDDLKLGGLMTNIVGEDLVCGIGLNIKSAPKGFAKLDIEISLENILNDYFNYLKNRVSWKHIFSNYKLEFHKSKNYFAHSGEKRFSLGDASLQDDGSIVSDGQRILSLR